MKILTTILTIALAAICTTIYAQNNSTSQTGGTVIVPKDSNPTNGVVTDVDDIVWANPHEKALFPGGDSVLRQYITDNMVCPESVKNTNLNGHVTVYYVIGKDGQVEPESVRIPIDVAGKYTGIDPNLDAELIRVVKSLPKFEPAYRHLYKYGEIEKEPVRTCGIITIRIRDGHINQIIVYS